MLNVSHLHVSYGESEVLHGLDFKVAPNEIVAIMGRNGMGKTTLMKSLMGIVPTKSGAVSIGDTDITKLKSYERVANGIAYVPQGRMIFSTMTVQENIETGLIPRGASKVPPDLYELFPVLLEMKGRRGGNLSGGQQQQLAIARALVTQPQLLILDEPTEGIQPNIVALIKTVLTSLKGRISILLVEQYLDFAIDVADAFVVLSRGAVVESGTAQAMSREHLTRHIAV